MAATPRPLEVNYCKEIQEVLFFFLTPPLMGGGVRGRGCTILIVIVIMYITMDT